MSRRNLTRAVLVACSTLLVASCSTTVQGTAVSVFDDPFSVAGMPAVDGPTGLRPDAREPSRDVENGDGGEIDELAAASISDIEDFWDTAYSETFDGDFIRVEALISGTPTGLRAGSSVAATPTVWSTPRSVSSTTPSAGTEASCCLRCATISAK
jgi:hypothetical protein